MKPTDDLELNAYIDGELSQDQQAEMLEAMRETPELARRACELSQLKAQMRLAYANPPQPRRSSGSGHRGNWPAVAAGVALLGVGMISGWLMHASVPGDGMAQRFVVLDPDGRGQAVAGAEDEDTRIVFHLTQADQAVAGELLDEVEHMLDAYEADGRALRVEVVSHSDGLDLLRERLSQHKGRIAAMAERYANLTFVACKNTIDRLRVEQGIEVRLIPGAEVIDSGVSHVVKRQREGWSYIRV
jgi:intracellular sulfur oxidation DsrE/DsrF family protein